MLETMKGIQEQKCKNKEQMKDIIIQCFFNVLKE